MNLCIGSSHHNTKGTWFHKQLSSQDPILKPVPCALSLFHNCSTVACYWMASAPMYWNVLQIINVLNWMEGMKFPSSTVIVCMKYDWYLKLGNHNQSINTNRKSSILEDQIFMNIEHLIALTFLKSEVFNGNWKGYIQSFYLFKSTSNAGIRWLLESDFLCCLNCILR